MFNAIQKSAAFTGFASKLEALKGNAPAATDKQVESKPEAKANHKPADNAFEKDALVLSKSAKPVDNALDGKKFHPEMEKLGADLGKVAKDLDAFIQDEKVGANDDKAIHADDEAAEKGEAIQAKLDALDEEAGDDPKAGKPVHVHANEGKLQFKSELDEQKDELPSDAGGEK